MQYVAFDDERVDRLVAQGRPDEAVALLRAARGVDEHYRTMRLADVLAEHGRLDEAVAVHRAAGGPLAPLGRLLARHGRVDEAIEVYREAVAAGERHVRRHLGRLLYEQRRIDEAIRVVREAIDDPADPGDRTNAYRTLGQLLVVEGRDAELDAERERIATVEDTFLLAEGAARGHRHLARRPT
ncbi:tetratricopeptide repeat protein [Micromonospora coxensis]|nr:tetratricopeptide repeat protein [Micromonospora coxensis]